MFEELVRTGIAKITYRHRIRFGPISTRVALATECAADQDAFWPFHDQLFELRRNEVTIDEFLMEIATDLSLDVPAFTGCLQDDVHLARIMEDETLAAEFGILGTPTIFVNGVQVAAFPAESIIDAVLAAAGEG